MSEFEFPTNIRQIGSIGDGMRIYMEDYVCSYLQQLTDEVGNEERYAILIGREMVIDSNPVLFISGAIHEPHVVVDGDNIIFPEKTWQYAEQQIKKYFKGLDIVGWVLSQPGYGTRLRQQSAAAHKSYFSNKGQVVFVLDPVERINAFYIWEQENGGLIETRGYFVYYDKNRGMHEYMLDNRAEKKRPLSGDIEEARPVMPRIIEKRKADTPETIIRRRQGERIRKSTGEQKKIINMLVSLSAVLFLVCFIMGAGLIRNDGRISSLERQLIGLNTSYRDVLVQLKEGRTAEVFAQQTEEPQAQLIEEDGNEVLAADLLAQGETEQETPTPTPTQPPTPEPTAESTPEPPVPSDPEPSDSALQVWDTYAVEKGDTLSYISEKFYGTSAMMDEIMEINGLDDPHMIYFGKVIKLPVME